MIKELDMGYAPPQLHDYLSAINEIEFEYKKKYQIEDEESALNANELNTVDDINRLKIKDDTIKEDKKGRLVAILLAKKLIQYLHAPERNFPAEEVQKLSHSILFFTREVIDKNEYKKWYMPWTAEYKEHFIGTTGSYLVHLLSNQLSINETNRLTSIDEFIYLVEFSIFILNTDKSTLKIDLEDLKSYLAVAGLDLLKCQETSINLIEIIIGQLKEQMNNIAAAIPKEEVLQQKMENLYTHYQELKKQQTFSSLRSLFHFENEDRKFHAQLGAAIAYILKTQNQVPGKDSLKSKKKVAIKGEIPRSQEQLLGYITYLMSDIHLEKKYFWPRVHSPQNSQLYLLASEISNKENPDSTLDFLKRDWYAAILSFLSYEPNRNAIIEYGQENFGKDNLLKSIDVKLDEVQQRIIKLIPIEHQFPISEALALFLGYLAAPTFFSLGANFGDYSANQDQALGAKMKMGNAVTTVANRYQSAAAGMGFFLANFLVNTTLIRFFAKTFELMGIIVGATAGYALGFTFDITYKGLKSLCNHLLHLRSEHEELSPYIKDADVRFINAILSMPPQVNFSQARQNKIQKLTAENFPEMAEDHISEQMKTALVQRSFS